MLNVDCLFYSWTTDAFVWFFVKFYTVTEPIYAL